MAPDLIPAVDRKTTIVRLLRGDRDVQRNMSPVVLVSKNPGSEGKALTHIIHAPQHLHMNSRLILSWCLLVLILSSSTLAAKNVVYKGSFSSTDLLTGEVTATALYVIFGEETPVDASTLGYNFLKGQFIFLNGRLGKKRYAVVPALPRFRSVKTTQQIGKKMKVKEVITQASAGNPTDSGDDFYRVSGFVLVGNLGNPKYDFPLTLKGYGMAASGGLGGPDAPPEAGAERVSFTLTLVQSLTDPIESGETVEATIERVTTFLTSQGFVGNAP